MASRVHMNVLHVFGVMILLVAYMKFGVGDGRMTSRCIERERQALLEFKQGIVEDYGRLSSWRSEEKECCKWRGVQCSNHTGHIIILDLHNLHNPGEPYQPLEGTNVSSSLLELQHLKYLDLADNYFGFIQIPEFIGSLSSLQYLNLSNSRFNGSIPQQLGNLTNLRSLDLSDDHYLGLSVENLDWLSNLRLLRHLDLSGVELGTVDWLKVISKLSFLTELHLHGCSLHGTISPSLRFTNFSFMSLAIVDLSFNFFSSSSSYNWLFNLSSSLVDIDMSGNQFDGPIPDAFGNMKSLAHLDLSDCFFHGEIPKSFGNLSHLHSLQLYRNSLTGQLPEFFQTLGVDAENSLEILDLSWNQLSGSLPDFTRFSSLRSLTLADNKLNGSFPESFGQISSLIILDLSVNQMTGSLPDLYVFPSLRELYLHYNKLNGRLPKSIGQLSELEALDVSSNSLEDTISEVHFSNLSNLKALDLSVNSLTLEFRSDWSPPFQLDVIRLAYCDLGTHFPKWLQSQNNYSFLDIPGAGISDTAPEWFWDLSPRLEYLNLSYNQISGILPDLSLKFTGFPMIDLSSNHFTGPIPLLPPNVSILQLSKNMLSRSIFVLCTISNEFFSFLDLSDNLLSGEVPDCLMRMKRLVILNLANNNFSGEIPSSIGFLNELQSLHLRNNSFTGELPSSLRKCTQLRVIDLGENKLSGKIPVWIGTHIRGLIVLSLRLNEFNGSIPRRICHLMNTRVLDLSQNYISGNIPSCFNNFTSLAQKNSSSDTIAFDRSPSFGIGIANFGFDEGEYVANTVVQWKGKESEYRKNLGLQKTIDLSSNKLVGKIPHEFASLEGLISLNLSRNNLTGNIIQKIDQMKMLEVLDLSWNQLSGEIPSGLASLTFLSDLDLSYNNLSGKIPSSTQLQGFNASVYAENPELCGLPLPNKCPEDETPPVPPPIDHSKDDSIQEDNDTFITPGFYVSMGLGFIFGFWGVFGPLLVQSSWSSAYFKLLEKIIDWIYVTTTVNMARLQRRLRG